jgi:GDPmannose 4,6-dehydratase
MILHYGDLTDTTNLVYIISQVMPSEIYNLGAQSHVKVSFEMAEYTGDVDGLGTLRILDAIRTAGLEKHVRFYQVRLIPFPLDRACVQGWRGGEEVEEGSEKG